MKRLAAVFLILILTFSFTYTNAAFSDDTIATPEEVNAVSLLKKLGIVGGYPGDTFGYKKEISRAEFLKILFLLNGKTEKDLPEDGAEKFSDVTEKEWYYKYVIWAAESGIIGGYPDGTFKGDNKITFAEAAKMFLVTLGFGKNEFTYPEGFINKALEIKLFSNVSEVTAIGSNTKALRGKIAQMSENFLFICEVPTYEKETPAEKYFAIKKEVAVITGTSTAAPGNAEPTITENGVVSLKSGETEKQKKTNLNCDRLLGHRVNIWCLGEELVAVTDDTDFTISQTYDEMQAASGPVGARMQRSDIYAYSQGEDIELYRAKRDEKGEAITKEALLNNSSKYPRNFVDYYFWEAGKNGTGSDGNSNWIINGGAGDSGFGSVALYPWNQQGLPFTQSMHAVFTFIDYDVDGKISDVDRTKEAWDMVIVNFEMPGEITAIDTDSVTVANLNDGKSIPFSQIKNSDNLKSAEPGDRVSVEVTSAVYGNQIIDIYDMTMCTKYITHMGTGGRGYFIYEPGKEPKEYFASRFFESVQMEFNAEWTYKVYIDSSFIVYMERVN